MNFIGDAQNVNRLCLSRLEDVVALDNLPDGFLLLRKGGILGLNLGSVGDTDGLLPGLKNWLAEEVQLFTIKLNDRTS